MLHLFASTIAVKLYKNDNGASEFIINICGHLLYVYNNYGFIMHQLHAYKLDIASKIFGFKDYHYFIDCDQQKLILCEYSMLWRLDLK